MIRASSGKAAGGRLLIGVGVLALLIPAVAGCEAGADAPTLQFHAASSGAQTVFNGIKITNAFVLAAPSGSSVPAGSSASLFVSLYNSGESTDTLLNASAPGAAGSISLSGGTVALPANSSPVNLTGPEPEVVLENLSKPLAGGTYIPVTFNFEHAGTVTLQVPVEAQSFQWSSFSPPAAVPTGAAASRASTTPATPVTSSTGTASPKATASGKATPKAAANGKASPSGKSTPTP